MFPVVSTRCILGIDNRLYSWCKIRDAKWWRHRESFRDCAKRPAHGGDCHQQQRWYLQVHVHAFRTRSVLSVRVFSQHKLSHMKPSHLICHNSNCHSSNCHTTNCYTSDCHTSNCHTTIYYTSNCHTSDCHVTISRYASTLLFISLALQIFFYFIVFNRIFHYFFSFRSDLN